MLQFNIIPACDGNSIHRASTA